MRLLITCLRFVFVLFSFRASDLFCSAFERDQFPFVLLLLILQLLAKRIRNLQHGTRGLVEAEARDEGMTTRG